MTGGGLGPYRPGEWSDDTQMGVCIAEIAVTGVDLSSELALDAIGSRFLAWMRRGASDIEPSTQVVLSDAIFHREEGSADTAYQLLRSAAATHRARTGRAAGNGALARTPFVALMRLNDRQATARAARAVAELTHMDPLAGDGCVLWCEAIRTAIMSPADRWYQRINLTAGLDLIPQNRRELWVEWIDTAYRRFFQPPTDNTSTVAAMQAAIGAVTLVHWEQMRSQQPIDVVRTGVEAAVRIGGDTDTVASLTGSLLGAACGIGAIPASWRNQIHGWPGMRADGLADLATGTALAGLASERMLAGTRETARELEELTIKARKFLQ